MYSVGVRLDVLMNIVLIVALEKIRDGFCLVFLVHELICMGEGGD